MGCMWHICHIHIVDKHIVDVRRVCGVRKGKAWGVFWADCIHGCHKGVWSRKRVSLGVYCRVDGRRGCGVGKRESWGV
jgi:hypothetical protein